MLAPPAPVARPDVAPIDEPTTLGPDASTTQPEVAVAAPDYDYARAVGPEATPEEATDWIAKRFPHATPEQVEASQRDALEELALGPDELPEGRSFLRLPTRRSLEAVLAAWEGQAPDEYAAANAHRPWAELAAETLEVHQLDGAARLNLAALATDAEWAYRRSVAQSGQPPAPFAAPTLAPADYTGVEHLVAKLGPGARSGNLSDYSRAELRKLLGYLERDCKHLTDEDLRGMALDGHLVPQWEGAPSHAELAARSIAGYSWRRDKRFAAAMRKPYGDLARGTYGYNDGDDRPADELRAELAARHPFLLRQASDAAGHDYQTLGRNSTPSVLHELAKRNGIATKRDEQRRNRVAAGAQTTQLTAIELAYKPAFDDFCEQFGDRKPAKIYGNLGRRGRGCLGYYSPGLNEIHINSGYAKKLRDPNVSPREVEAAVSTLAHELGHAVSGRDAGDARTGRKSTRTAEHCIDEGITEGIFGRVHCQALAERMGVWSAERGNLREHADGGSYAREVETVLALGAAACGELDKDKLRAGAYAQPEALSKRAQTYLQDLHVRYGPQGRIEQLSKTLADRGLAADDAESAVRRLLVECKSNRYEWRTKRVPATSPDGKQMRDTWGSPVYRYENVKPDDLGPRLAGLLEDMGL